MTILIITYLLLGPFVASVMALVFWPVKSNPVPKYRPLVIINVSMVGIAITAGVLSFGLATSTALASVNLWENHLHPHKWCMYTATSCQGTYLEWVNGRDEIVATAGEEIGYRSIFGEKFKGYCFTKNHHACSIADQETNIAIYRWQFLPFVLIPVGLSFLSGKITLSLKSKIFFESRGKDSR